MSPSIRAGEAARLFKHLARLVQATHLYPGGNERQLKSASIFLEALRAYAKPFRVTLMGNEAVVEEETVEEITPVEALLIRKLREADWEGLRIEPGIERGVLIDMTLQLIAAQAPPVKGRGFLAGHLTLESAREQGLPVTSAAVGYLKLLSGAQHTVEELGKGKASGLEGARQVVAGLAAHIATGRNIFQPVRSLKSFDEYTFTHALNVSLITMSLGKTLSIPTEVLENISLGALCHDVGKERIPKDILHKTLPLTPDERAIIERHSAEGARILLHLPDKVPAVVPVMAYQHHIYQNGTGYPARLPRQAIHPASLLVSVADTFDALRTVRPYSPARTAVDAFNIVLFDARRGKLVKSFVAALASLIGVTAEGRRVGLADGKEGRIVCENPVSPLEPLVRCDDGEERDLALEEGAGIVTVLESNP